MEISSTMKTFFFLYHHVCYKPDANDNSPERKNNSKSYISFIRLNLKVLESSTNTIYYVLSLMTTPSFWFSSKLSLISYFFLFSHFRFSSNTHTSCKILNRKFGFFCKKSLIFFLLCKNIPIKFILGKKIRKKKSM
jgi:hypothetical protein